MAEQGFEARLEPAARRFLDQLPDAEARAVWRLIGLIETDPYIDGVVKVTVDLPPAVVTVYTHPDWLILYRIPANGRIAIDAISPRYPEPHWAPRRRRQ